MIYTKGTEIFGYKLDMIYTLRNAFVHGNGRTAAIKSKDRRKILNWSENKEGIKIFRDEYIVINQDFISDCMLFIKRLLNSLIARVEQT